MVQLVIEHRIDGEAEARIHDRKIDAQFRQAFVEQGRQQRRCLVQRMTGDTPPDGTAQAMVLAFLDGGAIPRVVAMPQRADFIDARRAADFAQVFQKDRDRLHPVSVAVDDRVFQPGAYLCCAIAHGHCSFREFKEH